MSQKQTPVLLLLIWWSITSVAQPLPNAALSLPVLITLSNGESASGFYLESSNHLFLATARHVLFDLDGKLNSTEMDLLSGGHVTNEGDFELKVNLGILSTNGEIRANQSHDVTLVRLARKNLSGQRHFITNAGLWISGQGITPVTIPQHGMTWVASHLSSGENLTRRLSEVLPGEDVFVFGYPTSIGLKQSPKFDYSRPLLRKGIVSGIYEKGHTIILDSSVYFGNSGGPVMTVSADRQFKVIGIVSEIIPFVDIWENKRYHYETANLSNSGYSVVEPVDFLLDLMWDD